MKKLIITIIALNICTLFFAQDVKVLELENGIRIGKIGEIGTKAVPIGAIAMQYNIDFTGYRDISKDQIGARIAAIRFNRYQSNNALIQNTGLAFFTNAIGGALGTTELLERMRITPNGNVGIGVTEPQSKLDVNGTIRAKEVKIESTGWADFVFKPEYKLPTLSEVENHILEHGHLPSIPSAKEVQENGVDVGQMQTKLLQKIEELTLYIISLEKRIVELENE